MADAQRYAHELVQLRAEELELLRFLRSHGVLLRALVLVNTSLQRRNTDGSTTLR